MQLVAAAFQLIGTFMFNEIGSNLFAWSLSGALIPLLLVAINTLRNQRNRTDRALASIALVGNFAWMGFILLFGHTQGSLVDPRILLHALAAFGLGVFSLLALVSVSVDRAQKVATSQPAH